MYILFYLSVYLTGLILLALHFDATIAVYREGKFAVHVPGQAFEE